MIFFIQKRMLIAVVTVLVLGGVLILLRPAPETKPAATSQPKAALTVSLIKPITVDWPVTFTANGNISAWQEAVVGAEASGLRLTEVLVNVGDRVSKGQVLARLQSDTLSAELDQIKAGLAEAEAAQAEAKANADRARQVEKTGAISAQQIAQYLTAEQTAAARVAALKAQIKTSQIRLEQTRIVAPDTGTITSRSATLGAVVQPGQELYRLNRNDRLEWRAELPADELARIKPGMKAALTVGSGKLKGRVRMVAPTVEAQSRNGLVYVDLLEIGEARAGMFARGEIETGRGKLLALPQTAVLLRDGFSYVFRIGLDGRVVQAKVNLGQRVGDLVAVTSGLDANAELVATGVGFLADGDMVRIAPAAAK